MRTVLWLGTCDDKRKLAARPVTQRGEDLGGSPAQNLLVHFGQLACHGDAALRQRLRDPLERFPDPVRRLERDRRPRVLTQRVEQTARFARFARKGAEEREARSPEI